MIYLFGEHTLDDARLQLLRGGQRVPLQPKAFNLLQHLIEQRPEVVSKEALLAAIWPDETLTDSVLARTVAAIRKALGQQRGQRQPIETDYGRGYRFTAAVRAVDTGDRAADGAGSSAGGAGGAARAEFDGEGSSEPISDPFVGRAGTLQRLQSNLDTAAAGQGRLLLLAGEPGIGKTRAAEELCARARRQGATVWTGRCFDGEGAPAFWPFIQVLRACAHDESPAALRAFCGADRPLLARLVPELDNPAAPAPFASEVLTVGDSETAAANQRFRLLDSLSRFLVRAAEHTPRVLFLDDLQWADAASIQVLGFLVQEIGTTRLLLLGTIREPALPHEQPTRDMLDSLIRPRASERLALSGLSEADVEAYIGAISGRAAPAGLAAAVLEKTAGNPLFVRESLQLLLDDAGRFPAAPARAEAGWQVELPEMALDVIRRRIRDLDSELRNVLECAAVFGSEFAFAPLQQVLQMDEQALLDALGDAQALSVIEELPGRIGAYAFGHVLLRDTLYNDLPSRTRVALHRRIGEAMAATHGKRSERNGEIAHHFHRALPDHEIAQQAVDYARRAGDAAMAIYAFDEAAQRYASALEAYGYLRPPRPAQRFRLLLLSGQALGMGGQSARASESFFRALEVARGMGDAEMLGWAAYALALVTRAYFNHSDAVDAAIQEALTKLPEGDRLLRPRLLMEAAQPTVMATRPEARRRLAEEAIALLDPADPETPWRILRARLLANSEPGQIDERLQVLEQLIALADDQGVAWLRMEGKRTRYPLHIELGDVLAADRDLADCVQISSAHRLALGAWFTQVAGLGRAHAEGRLQDVDRLLPQVVATGHALHTPAAELLQRVHESQLMLTRGDTEGLAQAPLDLERDFAWTGQSARIGGMRFLMLLGRTDEARPIYDSFAKADFDNVPVNEYLVSSLVGLAEAAYLLRDRTGGKRIYTMLRPLSERVAIDGLYIIEGTARGALGLLSALDHDYEAACEHFEASVERLRRMGFRALACGDQLHLAGALLRRGGQGDRVRAETLAEQAGEEAAELGALALVARARDLQPL